MRLYRWVSLEQARRILDGPGFEDTRFDGLVKPLAGVWVTDEPREYAMAGRVERADVLLAIDDLDERDVAPYEYTDNGEVAQFYREWLVPADLLNRRGLVSIDIDRMID